MGGSRRERRHLGFEVDQLPSLWFRVGLVVTSKVNFGWWLAVLETSPRYRVPGASREPVGSEAGVIPVNRP
jgi:hypothetical protein